MKINWKVRFRNPIFVWQFILAVLSPALLHAGLSIFDITTWKTLWDLLIQAYSNPVLLGAMFYGGYNALTDPTTRGFCDSDDALKYKEPKG